MDTVPYVVLHPRYSNYAPAEVKNVSEVGNVSGRLTLEAQEEK